jgi:lipoprotein signal peptidase
VIADRLSKWWIDANLGQIEGTSIPVIAPWLYLTYIEHRGSLSDIPRNSSFFYGDEYFD